MNPFLHEVVSLLFPQRCIFCGHVTGHSDLCCATCDTRLRRRGDAVVLTYPDLQIYSCFYNKERCGSTLYRFKFGGERQLAEGLAEELCSLLTVHFPDFPFDAVVYPPMPRVRQEGRGYNQAELLGSGVAAHYGVPCGTCGLTRPETFAQHDLNSSMRRKQSFSGYAMEEGVTPPRRLLLVDDITTTGSSLLGCARLLRGAGAAEITAVTVAR